MISVAFFLLYAVAQAQARTLNQLTLYTPMYLEGSC